MTIFTNLNLGIFSQKSIFDPPIDIPLTESGSVIQTESGVNITTETGDDIITE